MYVHFEDHGRQPFAQLDDRFVFDDCRRGFCPGGQSPPNQLPGLGAPGVMDVFFMKEDGDEK